MDRRRRISSQGSTSTVRDGDQPTAHQTHKHSWDVHPTEDQQSRPRSRDGATGLLESLASRKSPIYATLFGRLQFRMCLAYPWLLLWAVRSILEIIYALVPAYCIITNSHSFTKVNDPVMAIPTLLFLTYNIFTLFEYFQIGLSVRAWWNNQWMQQLTSARAWPFGFLGVVLKLLGISQTVFKVTKKVASTPGDGETVPAGKFTFDESPVFIPGTTLVLVELTALVMMVLGLRPQAHGSGGTGIGEVICATWVVMCFRMFVRGLFEKKGDSLAYCHQVSCLCNPLCPHL